MSIRMMRPTGKLWAVLAVSLVILFPSQKVAGDNMYRLAGHIPFKQLRDAKYIGSRPSGERMKLAVSLRPRDRAGLEDFLKRVQDPSDPLYHHFLTPAEFTERFAPSEQDVQAVVDHLSRNGAQAIEVHPNRLIVDFEGSTADVENVFQVQIYNYQKANGKIVFSANNEPNLPSELVAKIHGVSGLSSFAERKPRLNTGIKLSPNTLEPQAGINDYLTPANIKTTYNLNSVTQTGTGETLALFELAGYTPADITFYASHFGITAPTLQNVLVDGYDGSPGTGAEEVTLDIELAAAIAPGLAKIMVYEGPNNEAGALHTYSKIANDNLASVVSISWGLSEDDSTSAFLNSENTIFQQMAAQGQSVFAAAGDNGAYDSSAHPSNLSVDDPASQPFVTGVGGTKLHWTANGGYSSESAWGNSANATGGGGGLSKYWSTPSWQSSLASNNIDGVNPSYRMVPDVSLDADPTTGYAIYYSGAWYAMGGTSCGAPLWGAFATLVNQKRVADGLSRLGFANPSLYQVARSASYSAAFLDPTDFTSNLKYLATPYYDLATGWGSFNGAGLHGILSAATLPSVIAAPGAPTSIQVGAGQ